MKGINMRKYIITKKWIESYENPIILKNGDRVSVDLSVKDLDVDWANWGWCTSSAQMTGWVPTQILKRLSNNPDNTQDAIVAEDYSAYELSVDKGDIVFGNRILNNWLWCRKQNLEQEGWVPRKKYLVFVGRDTPKARIGLLSQNPIA